MGCRFTLGAVCKLRINAILNSDLVAITLSSNLDFADTLKGDVQLRNQPLIGQFASEPIAPATAD